MHMSEELDLNMRIMAPYLSIFIQQVHCWLHNMIFVLLGPMH